MVVRGATVLTVPKGAASRQADCESKEEYDKCRQSTGNRHRCSYRAPPADSERRSAVDPVIRRSPRISDLTQPGGAFKPMECRTTRFHDVSAAQTAQRRPFTNL